MRQLLGRLFGRPATVAPPAADPAARREVQMANAIATAFSHHGIRCSTRGEIVEFPDSGVVLRPLLHGVVEHGDTFRSHVEVQLALPDGRVVEECVVGFGQDPQSAIYAGVMSFFQSDLHVVTHALFRAAADEQITLEEWTIRGEPYEVSIGPALMRGTPPETFEAWVSFEVLENAVRASGLTGDLHWIRFFYAHGAGATAAVEVLLDNEHWVTVEQQVAALDWPRSDAYYSIRIFLMLRRLG